MAGKVNTGAAVVERTTRCGSAFNAFLHFVAGVGVVRAILKAAAVAAEKSLLSAKCSLTGLQEWQLVSAALIELPPLFRNRGIRCPLLRGFSPTRCPRLTARADNPTDNSSGCACHYRSTPKR